MTNFDTVPTVPAETKTISLKGLENVLLVDLVNGIDLETFKSAFTAAKNSQVSLLAEIDKAYTIADLKKKVRSHTEKKAGYVSAYLDGLMCSFHVHEEMFSYTWEWGQTTENIKLRALEKSVDRTTQADIDNYRDRKAARRAAIKKTLTDPETLEEFQTFIRVKGLDALTDAQRLAFDTLKANKAREEAREEAARRATVTAPTVDGLEGEIVETKHTQKGHDLFVVQLSKRVDKDTYNAINTAAKRLGGYYSSFTGRGAVPGFQFTERHNAEQFLGVLAGEKTDGAAVVAEREAINQAKRANRFFEMADRLEEVGREALNRDRKSNTARRARMAASAESKAQSQLKWAGILKTMGERLEAGTLLYLDKITALTQMETLSGMMRNAHRRRCELDGVRSWEVESVPFEVEKALLHIDPPHAVFYKSTVKEIANRCSNKPGHRMRCARLLKACAKIKGDRILFRNTDDIEALSTVFPHSGLDWELQRVKRLHAAGITTTEILRMAVREFREIETEKPVITTEERQTLLNREIEREFVGRKIDGFFPTPPALINQMLDQCDFFDGCRILEPSAGLGHIILAAREHVPDAEIFWCEVNPSLSAAITKRDIPATTFFGSDFLAIEPGYTPGFDFILMNPPFENRQDAAHVMHAYQFLRNGGTLVAIIANRDGQAGSAFYDWIYTVGGEVTNNEAGAFKSAFRPTGVNTQMVVIRK